MSGESNSQDALHQKLKKLSVRSDQYKKAGLDADKSAAARRNQAQEASRETRAAVLRSKRLRRTADELSESFDATRQQPESPQTKIQNLMKAINSNSTGLTARLAAVRKLRQMLSKDDASLAPAVQAGVGQCLAKALVLRQHSSLELKLVFEAAWAVTSMAAGSHDSVQAVLPLAPVLIVLVQSQISMHIAEQAAWALGNMAAESAAVRATLQANGIVRPLVRLILAAMDHPDSRIVSAACTAAWALSNLLQDSRNIVNEVLALEKAPEGLLKILATSAYIELIAEVAWVICYAAFSQTNLNRLVHLGLISAVVPQITSCLQEAEQDSIEATSVLLRPLLRITGNIAALGGKDACSALMADTASATLQKMICACLQCQDEGLQAEAAWLCANLVAMPDMSSSENAHEHRGQKAVIPLLAELQDVAANGSLYAKREATVVIDALQSIKAC